MRKLLALAALSCVLVSCALLSVLPAVLRFVDEAEVVLNSIESFEHQYFEHHSDAQLENDVGLALHTARAQLATDRATVQLLRDPTPETVSAAFEDFYASYKYILQLTHRIGVQGVPLGSVAASRDGLLVPNVEALRSEIHR